MLARRISTNHVLGLLSKFALLCHLLLSQRIRLWNPLLEARTDQQSPFYRSADVDWGLASTKLVVADASSGWWASCCKWQWSSELWATALVRFVGWPHLYSQRCTILSRWSALGEWQWRSDGHYLAAQNDASRVWSARRDSAVGSSTPAQGTYWGCTRPQVVKWLSIPRFLQSR